MVLFSTTQADVALASLFTIDVGTEIVCKDVQPLRTFNPNEDTFVRLNSLSEIQPKKASSPDIDYKYNYCYDFDCDNNVLINFMSCLSY
jgi:hypothetical protein